MRVAMVTADYLPFVGGIASHVYELSRAMLRQGHEVQVWFHDPLGTVHKTEGEVPVVLLESPRPRRAWPRARAVQLSLIMRDTLRQQCARFRPELIHVHTMAPMSLSMRWLGANTAYRRIFTNHSSGYLKMILSWVGRRQARFYCGAFDGLLAPSGELLQKSRLLGIGDGRCRYIPNGVDAEKFCPRDPEPARARLRLPGDSTILLSTRRFAQKNGLRHLAMAVARVKEVIPEVLCVFCGDACDAAELPAVKRIVADHQLEQHVRFEGAIPNHLIGDYLAACDIMMLPSLMEATSISGLEAMASGRPIVGTRVGGIPEIVDDGRTGLLVDPADADSLADGIVKMMRQADRKAMGLAARQRVLEEFSWDRIASRTTEFYQQIAAMPPR